MEIVKRLVEVIFWFGSILGLLGLVGWVIIFLLTFLTGVDLSPLAIGLGVFLVSWGPSWLLRYVITGETSFFPWINPKGQRQESDESLG